jgi:glutamate formiminotransferase / formiminotetrahydrofolate cyclodeaminase
MASRIVECVPNFSEGRDAGKVQALVDAVCSDPKVVFLDQEIDADHNRCVLTFAGPPEEVLEAALRAVGRAVELIDLNVHTGVHPRVGAADVVPFVPVEGVTLEECVRLAERAGAEIWKRFGVPVYLYEAAARKPDRVNLENIRRGQFEGLREEVRTNPDRAPDIGDASLHPTAGATVVGARRFLIAYNINLNTHDVEIAKKIAKAVRFSSGGFRYVKAMGVPLASRNLAQVSINLTDFEQTPVHRVFEAVRLEAARYGVAVAGSEIVGLIPKKALEITADFYLRCENFRPEIVFENRLAEAAEEAAAAGGLNEFLDSIAAPTPAPGGGSAAAAAGALAASLGAMVSAIAKLPVYDFDADRRFLAAAVERDAAAFRKVMAAYKMPKAERAPYVEAALHEAATVPMEVAEAAASVLRRLGALNREAPSKFESDLTTGLALAGASIEGALANVRINLDSITDSPFAENLKARVAAIKSK